MNIRKELKNAYMSGVSDASIASMITGCRFDFKAMADHYADSRINDNKNKCKHKNKKLVFEDYPDRCTHYRCNDCSETVFIDWE